MNVIAFNGSPAGRESATHVLERAFLQGAERGGAQVETVFLAQQRIAHCQGCFACWFRTPGRCVLEDDMAQLLARYQSADLVCFGTPVYTWNMTAMLKNFVDRLAPLKCPQVTARDGRFDLQDAQPRTQQFVVLSNCGFPGEHNFEVMRAAFACCQPVLEIYRSCGKLLRSRDARAQALVKPYLAAVEQAGYELVTVCAVSDENRARLAAPLMQPDAYVAWMGMG